MYNSVFYYSKLNKTSVLQLLEDLPGATALYKLNAAAQGERYDFTYSPPHPPPPYSNNTQAVRAGKGGLVFHWPRIIGGGWGGPGRFRKLKNYHVPTA